MTYYCTSSYQEYDILIIITLVILLYKYILWPRGVAQAPQAKWSGWFVLWGVSQPLRFRLEIDDSTYSVQTKQFHSPTGLVLFDYPFKSLQRLPELTMIIFHFFLSWKSASWFRANSSTIQHVKVVHQVDSATVLPSKTRAIWVRSCKVELILKVLPAQAFSEVTVVFGLSIFFQGFSPLGICLLNSFSITVWVFLLVGWSSTCRKQSIPRQV